MAFLQDPTGGAARGGSVRGRYVRFSPVALLRFLNGFFELKNIFVVSEKAYLVQFAGADVFVLFWSLTAFAGIYRHLLWHLCESMFFGAV